MRVASPARPRDWFLLMHVASILVALVAGQAVIHAVWVNHCPTGTVFGRQAIQSPVLFVLPWMILGPSALALVRSRVATPSSAGSAAGVRHARAVRWMVAASIILAALSTWLAAGSELCLAPAGVVTRQSSLSPIMTHAWRDVVLLRTHCAWHSGRRQSSLRQRADITLRGGETFWLNRAEYRAGYRWLGGALKGVTYQFDNADIDLQCPDADLALFRLPPPAP